MMKKLLRLATLALLFTGVASAQTTGSITGVVTDGASGKPVIGAVVVATSPAAPGEQSAVTDAKGSFTIGNLPAGKYKLTASFEGYKTETRADLVLGENVTLRANVAIVPEAVQMEEVVVTGSRIKRKDLTAAAPVTVVSKEQIAQSGKVNLGEFLQTIPEQGNTVNAQVNNGNDGSVRINLRSLGSARTLVLLNGRRHVAGGTGADQSVDLNTIPAAAVERIEVLKDGASAVYGSDAIAGVVNVITKKRYNGTDVSAYVGQSSRGDGTTYDVSATTGTGSEKGNLLFSVGYQKQEPIYAGDRNFAKQTYAYDFTTGNIDAIEGNSGTTPDGRFSLPTGACTAPTDPDVIALCALPGTTNNFIPNGDGTFRRGSELYNTYPTNYLYTPSERIQIFSTGDANLGSVARAFYEASYVKRTSAQNLAPMPVVMNSGTGNPISAESMYNPFGVDIISWRKRTLEFGNRSWTQDLDTFRVVVGLDGALGDWAGPLRGWNWEATYNNGQTTGTEENGGLLWANRIGTAVGPSFQHPVNGPVCGDVGTDGIAGTADDNIIIGCIPMNVLGGQGTLTPEMQTYVGYRGTLKGYSKMEVYSANLGGELFKLMSDRPVGLSVGVDYRTEKGLYLPDPVSAGGISTGNNASPTEGHFHVTEGYGELLIPVINNVPGIYDLELSLAARVFDYSTFGSDSTYKAGLRYAPVRDVVLRGTYSTAFRAPNIGELYAAGASDSYDFTPNGDPCANVDANGDPLPGPIADPALSARCVANGTTVNGSGDAATQFLTKKGANPNLEPETAKILTVGAVIEPRWVPNLTFTLDYYMIDLTKTIVYKTAPVILEGCFSGSSPAYCNLISRDADGIILQIDDQLANISKTKTAGLDVAARYNLATGGLGQFGFLIDATFLQYYDRTEPDGSVIKGKGVYDLGVLPDFKGNAAINWSMGGFGAGVTGRYIHSYVECESTVCAFDPAGSPRRTVDAYLTADLYLNYTLKSAAGTTGLTFGVQNVADTQPVFINGAANYSADPDYQYAGRFFYGRVAQTF